MNELQKLKEKLQEVKDSPALEYPNILPELNAEENRKLEMALIEVMKLDIPLETMMSLREDFDLLPRICWAAIRGYSSQ